MQLLNTVPSPSLQSVPHLLLDYNRLLELILLDRNGLSLI
jgi:hypothetical protein